MISSSQREHLVYTLTGQISIITLCIGWTFYYILPGNASIAESRDSANQKIAQYNSLKKDGLSVGEIRTIAGGSPEYEELIRVINLSEQNTVDVIKKDTPELDYIEWIKGKLISSEDDKNILIQTKKLINSIIPTLTSAGSIEEEMLTLKGLISFVEQRLIKQFNVKSNTPIGLVGMNFGKVKDIPEGIGYLDLRMEVSGTSDNIMKLIRYINKSGDPILLSGGLVKSGENPKVLDNPLMTITQFSLQDLPTNLGPDEENVGRLGIRIYLRGGAVKDIKSFQNNLITRIDSLIYTVKDERDKCKNDKNLCQNEEKMKDYEEKLRIIRKGMNDAIANKGGLGQIYVLSQFFNTIKNLEDSINLDLSR